MSAANYTYFRGYRCCTCVAEWFPVYERMLALRGITSGTKDGRLRIFQFTGTAAASAGTHSQGGAMDTAMLDPSGIRLAREMGASASWIRWWPGNLHAHMVLAGCPHNGPARYQITAVKAGFDGTGWLGRGGRDTEWRPRQWRTWREGLAWARAQLAVHELQEEADMPLTEAEIDKIAERVWARKVKRGKTTVSAIQELADAKTLATQIKEQTGPVKRGGKTISLRQEIADTKTLAIAQEGRIAGLSEAVKQLASTGGVDLTRIETAVETAISKSLAGLAADVTLTIDTKEA